ncbi:MAG: hypothetical protein HY248_06680, partial [Fimbriimonas ginsengisoli]|nr:hypothetical protein [Fimbriimonas ginsengisoli]
AMLPGALQTIKRAEKLGVEPNEAKGFLQVPVGEGVAAGQIIAESKGFLGMFKSSIPSEYEGTIEAVSEVSGHVLVREPSIPVGVDAYVEGSIHELLPGEGAIVETRCAMVQGIFGVGGERTGVIRVAVPTPEQVLEASDILATDSGRIVVGGSGMTLGAIRRAAEVGACGILAGGIKDSDLVEFLGYDIGVAITGQESINLSLVVTEGFGFLPMARRTFELLLDLDGKRASMNGATQIRAGVIRPEIIVPVAKGASKLPEADSAFELKPGTPIRAIREPYFGKLGVVTDLPAQLQVVESGTEVRVLKAKVDGLGEVVIPRANVEIIAT